jgi:hypothetical protein
MSHRDRNNLHLSSARRFAGCATMLWAADAEGAEVGNSITVTRRASVDSTTGFTDDGERPAAPR